MMPPMSKAQASTIPSRGRSDDDPETPVPRLVAIWADGRPVCIDRPLHATDLVVGRGGEADLVIDDASVSRAHARIGYDGARWSIQDLGSRNGTYVDGRRLHGELLGVNPRVIRLGDAILIPMGDLGGTIAAPEVQGSRVIGARMRRVWATIASLAGVSSSLYFRGESGSGKELAARELHRSARPRGPFVAVNCAAIPESLAEALLFGVRRGAFSGAVEASEGYLRSADSGVLFLDEIGELSLTLQSKLLRALETRCVVPVGDTRTHPVDLQLCVATHHDLRELVRAGRFREDLYYRIGRPMIDLPPLRQRREDLPWLVSGVLAELDPGLACDAQVIEACVLRQWPGNVRELITELRVAGQNARQAGRSRVTLADLAADAGMALARPPDQEPVAPRQASARPAMPTSAGQRRQLEAREVGLEARRGDIEAALRGSQGNVSGAARQLGIHRTQLRRWLTHLAIDPAQYAGGSA